LALASAGLGPGENVAPQTVQPVDVIAEVPHISEDLGTFHLVTFQGNECSIVDNLQMDDADVCVFLGTRRKLNKLIPLSWINANCLIVLTLITCCVGPC